MENGKKCSAAIKIDSHCCVTGTAIVTLTRFQDLVFLPASSLVQFLAMVAIIYLK